MNTDEHELQVRFPTDEQAEAIGSIQTLLDSILPAEQSAISTADVATKLVHHAYLRSMQKDIFFSSEMMEIAASQLLAFCFQEISSVIQSVGCLLNPQFSSVVHNVHHILVESVLQSKKNFDKSDIHDAVSGNMQTITENNANVVFSYVNTIFSSMSLDTLFPIFGWSKLCTKDSIWSDFVAGLTVGILLIPQGISYSLIAGLPPIHGLYSAFVPLVVYSVMGTSRHLAAGPMAVVSLTILSSLQGLAEPLSDEYIRLALILSLLVGLLKLLLGVLKFGFVTNLLSYPIVTGYTSGASLIIALGQLRFLCGIPIRSTRLHELVVEVISNIHRVNHYSLLFGFLNFFILYTLSYSTTPKKIPSASILLLVSVPISFLSHYAGFDLTIVGDIPSGLPRFSVPEVRGEDFSNLLVPAMVTAFVSYISLVAVAQSFALKFNYQINANQEFIAFGFANIAGSFFQSFPMTGGLARTAVNVEAGAKTQLAGLFTAAFIGLLLMLLTPVFYYLPYPTLASIIMYSLRNLIDLQEAKFLWKNQRVDFCVFMVAFAVTVFVGIIQGIVASVVVSLLFVVHRTSSLAIYELAKIPGTLAYGPKSFKTCEFSVDCGSVVVVKCCGNLNYLNFSDFRTFIQNKITSQAGVRKLVIESDQLHHLDGSSAKSLVLLIKEFQKKDVHVAFSHSNALVEQTLTTYGLEDDGKFFCSTHAAVVFSPA